MDNRPSMTREQAIAEYSQLRQLYNGLGRAHSREQLLWRPQSGRAWCMAECAEHVALANRAYLDNIQPAMARASSLPAESEPFHDGGWLSAFLLKSVSPEARRKVKAPKKIRPLSVDPTEAFAKLDAAHGEILTLLTTERLPNLNRVRFQNPFVPLIRFTVGSAMLIMAAHARRHLLQAQRIPQTPGFPEK